MASGSELRAPADSGKVDLPADLAGLRQRYASLCEVLALPDLRTEAWHYGRPDRFVPAADSAAAGSIPSDRGDALALLLVDCGPAVIVRLGLDGADVQGSPEDFGGSIGIVSDGSPFAKSPALLGWLEALNERDSDRLEAEQLSRLGQVLLVDVQRDMPSGVPIHVIIDMPPGGKHRCEQLVVNAAANTSLSLHLHVTGDDHEQQSLLHLGVHLQLGEGAAVDMVRYQNTGASSDIRGLEIQRIPAAARCRSTSMFSGGRHLRHDVIASLLGQRSETVLRGLYTLSGRQTASIFSHQDHRLPNTHSDLLFKGTMLDRSAASYLGQISVAPDAQGTDAYQSNRSLLLSPQARSSSSPQLEIEANDVRCSHGASVANVSDEELFYLESRGIDPEAGRQLLISGFLAEIADLVPEGVLREYVYREMLGRQD